MKVSKNILLILIIVTFTSFVFAQDTPDQKNEEKEIIKVVTESYMEGISNIGDVKAIKKGFHPGFNILGVSGNDNLWKYPIYSWIESVEQKLKDGKFPPEEKITFKFPLIDITGNAAIAKIQYFKGEQQIYTDYLSLYKFKEGWRIVNKVFFEHPKPEKKD